MDSICIGGGEMVPGPSTLARIWNSWAKDSLTEKEFDERADDGKSSNDVPVRSEDVEVIRLSPKTLGRFRKAEGPGSLSRRIWQTIGPC